MYPDFLVIGAQKAGTTWLHRNLLEHPEIWMPENEVHYFDRIGDPSLRGRSGAEWYASVFEPGRGRVVGETTPGYSIVDRETVARAHALMPEAKIVFLMRNPIERAWSQAVMRFTKREGGVENVGDEEIRARFDHVSSRLRTDYLRTLENWGSFFPEERVFVGFLEDVRFCPEELLRRLYGFLGVDPSSGLKPAKMNKRINSRSTDEMPTRVASHLARAYGESIRGLDERFGGYASFWRFCARRLAEDPPAGESITYPLWDSPLREEWVATDGGEPSLRSGPLSSFRAGG